MSYLLFGLKVYSNFHFIIVSQYNKLPEQNHGTGKVGMFTAVRANQATSECVKVFKPLHVFHTLCVVDNFKHTRVQCLPITTDKSKPFFANVLKTKVFIAMQSVQKVKGSQSFLYMQRCFISLCAHTYTGEEYYSL